MRQLISDTNQLLQKTKTIQCLSPQSLPHLKLDSQFIPNVAISKAMENTVKEIEEKGEGDSKSKLCCFTSCYEHHSVLIYMLINEQVLQMINLFHQVPLRLIHAICYNTISNVVTPTINLHKQHSTIVESTFSEREIQDTNLSNYLMQGRGQN